MLLRRSSNRSPLFFFCCVSVSFLCFFFSFFSSDISSSFLSFLTLCNFSTSMSDFDAKLFWFPILPNKGSICCLSFLASSFLNCLGHLIGFTGFLASLSAAFCFFFFRRLNSIFCNKIIII